MGSCKKAEQGKYKKFILTAKWLDGLIFFIFPIYRTMHNGIEFSGEVQMGKDEDLINAVIERAQEQDGRKKLTCAEAFDLAQEFETAVMEVGHICNRRNIRICKCQLGCFR